MIRSTFPKRAMNLFITCIDLSKLLGGASQNIGDGQKVVITDEIMGVSQLLGHIPKIYTFGIDGLQKGEM